MANNYQLSTGVCPAVTCLCPTYGRFERLRDAVACFLLQDYGVGGAACQTEATLLVLNDAPVPIRFGTQGAAASLQASAAEVREEVRVSPSRRIVAVNRSARFASLGHKRQWLLEAAETEIVAHWDDDDLYLPWHLSSAASALLTRPGAACAKPTAAWWVVGLRERTLQCRGIHHNVFEGQMVFCRGEALDLGGYPPRVSGQAKALLEAFRATGQLHEWNPADADVSYVYRWGDGVHHVSGSGDSEASHERFGAGNRDFGNGDPLIPGDDPLAWSRARLAGQFRELLQGFRSYLSAEDWRRISARLLIVLSPGVRRPSSLIRCRNDFVAENIFQETSSPALKSVLAELGDEGQDGPTHPSR